MNEQQTDGGCSLRRFLNYRLHLLLSLSGAIVTRRCERDYGITRREWRMLALLCEAPGVSLKQLAESASLDKARTSRGVSELVGQELVRREVRADNNRYLALHPTEEGLALFRKLFREIEAFNQALAACLDKNERALFDRCLDKLIAQARALKAEEDATAPKRSRRGRAKTARPADALREWEIARMLADDSGDG